MVQITTGMSAAIAAIAAVVLPPGMLSAWLQAMRAEGPLSCYQGFSVAVISMAAYKALYFGLYDTAKNLLLPEVCKPMLSGGEMLQIDYIVTCLNPDTHRRCDCSRCTSCSTCFHSAAEFL
jgi:hypothetical protein